MLRNFIFPPAYIAGALNYQSPTPSADALGIAQQDVDAKASEYVLQRNTELAQCNQSDPNAMEVRDVSKTQPGRGAEAEPVVHKLGKQDGNIPTSTKKQKVVKVQMVEQVKVGTHLGIAAKVGSKSKSKKVSTSKGTSKAQAGLETKQKLQTEVPSKVSTSANKTKAKKASRDDSKEHQYAYSTNA